MVTTAEIAKQFNLSSSYVNSLLRKLEIEPVDFDPRTAIPTRLYEEQVIEEVASHLVKHSRKRDVKALAREYLGIPDLTAQEAPETDETPDNGSDQVTFSFDPERPVYTHTTILQPKQKVMYKTASNLGSLIKGVNKELGKVRALDVDFWRADDGWIAIIRFVDFSKEG